MRLLCFLTLSFIVPCFAAAQMYYPPLDNAPRVKERKSQPARLEEQIIPESDCTNQIDDDGNGLTDLEDFHCYFAPENFYGECKPSKIIWGSSRQLGFFMLNLETGDARSFPSPAPIGFTDLSWSSTGTLYASGEDGHIYQIDPYTFEATDIGAVEGHFYTNGMTGDNHGNLYIASFVSQYESNILLYNPATKRTTFILSLFANQLTSAGDLCFLNGYLYVSCLGNRIARINLATKEVKVIQIIYPGANDNNLEVGSWGMVTLGDGYLYVTTNQTGIYRVDTETGRATEYFSYDALNVFTTGLATYPDVCNAPGCRGEVNIDIKSPEPFCSNTGVLLEAKGVGFTTGPSYKWTLPDKTEINGQALHAKEAGEYMIRYYPANDTCGITNSVTLNIIENPFVSLGNDTAICKNTPFYLQPVASAGITQYQWQDGSSAANLMVMKAGQYFVETGNACGTDSDTINISYKPTPVVQLQKDTAICEYTSVDLLNILPNNIPVSFNWSTGETGARLKVFDPGVYWLDVYYNSCTDDKVRDTVMVMRKIDDCECFLYIPNAFTPNSDGRNDRFSMLSECEVKGTLQIFNRWGETVFTTTNFLSGWDGIKNGTMQPSGFYAYKVRYEYVGRPGVFSKNGFVHLLH